MGPKPHVGRGPHSAEHVVIAREAARRLAPEHSSTNHFEEDGASVYGRPVSSVARASCQNDLAHLIAPGVRRLGEGQEPEAPAVTREAEEDWGR